MIKKSQGDAETAGHVSKMKMPLAAEETAERRRTADNALASQRLEGLEPDPQVIAEVERYIFGKVEIGDIIEHYLARVKRGEA